MEKLCFQPERFRGVIVALNACYDKAGEVSPAACRALCRWYQSLGVRGVYVGGSTGEGLLLSLEERKTLAEAAVQAARGEMTVIVHAGCPATRDAVALARHAAAIGADAISAVPSVFYRLSEESIARHWTAIADAAELPFFIYNIPQLTGYDLSMELFRRMLAHPHVKGIKNSSESARQIQQFKEAGGPDFLVFNGPDEQFLAGRAMGADAGIGGTYGCMPELYLRLDALFMAGQRGEARRLQAIIGGFIERLCVFPSMYGACKAVIARRAVDIGAPRPPFLPVDPRDPAIERLTADIEGQIALWCM